MDVNRRWQLNAHVDRRRGPMEMTDDRLQEQQRHNDLKAFLDYEQRLRDAYARLQDPHPRGRLREDSMR